MTAAAQQQTCPAIENQWTVNSYHSTR